MTDHQGPEPRDPWAPPPERPPADSARPGDTRGGPGGPGIHEHPTMAEMPGAGAPPAYGYPAQPDPGGYAYPGAPTPPAGAGYAYPGPAGGPPTPPAQPGYGAQPPYGTQPPYGGPPLYPGYPGAGYPGYAPGYPGYPQPSNGLGVAAFVLGLLSVVACFTVFGPIVFGIPAVVLGALARGKASRGEATNGGLALAGLICGVVGIVMGAALTLLLVFGPGFSSDPGGQDRPAPSSDSRVQERI